MNDICFLLVHISLAYKLSITSSKRETAEGDCLLSTKLILKSLDSLEIPGGPILTKKAKGKATSVTDVLKVPPCLLASFTY